MAYIRIKKISNHSYAYLVENIITEKGPRQKVKKYLGRVYQFEKHDISESSIIIESSKNKKKILNKLVLNELLSIDFKQDKEGNYVHQSLIFFTDNLALKKKTKSKGLKEAIIALNEGYLSTFTLNRIINFNKTGDFNGDAHQLAKYFLEAGLNVSEDIFIKFYQNLK